MSFIDKFNFLNSQSLEIKDIGNDLASIISSDGNKEGIANGLSQQYSTNTPSSIGRVLSQNESQPNYFTNMEDLSATTNQSNYTSNMNNTQINLNIQQQGAGQSVRMDPNTAGYIISGAGVQMNQNAQQPQNMQVIKMPQSNIYNVANDLSSKQPQNQQYANQQILRAAQGGARLSDNSQLPKSMQQNNQNYSLQPTTGVKEIIEEILTMATKAGDAQSGVCRALIQSFAACKMDADSFFNFLLAHFNYKLQPLQEKQLRSFQQEIKEKNSIQQSNISANQQMAMRNVQIQNNQPQNININTQQMTQPNRIPQLTVVQNSQRLQQHNYSQMSQPVYSNMAQIPTRQQLIPRQTSAASSSMHLLKSDASMQGITQSMNSSLMTKESASYTTQVDALPPDANENLVQEEEPENQFDVAGINLKEEENILEQTSNFVRSKTCLDEPTFNANNIKSMLIQNLKTSNLTVNEVSIPQLIAQLSHSLELKIRKILNDATIQVRHRLNNYQLKAKHLTNSNIESKISFMEEVCSARENPKKSDRANSLKNNKSKSDSSERQRALLKQSFQQDEMNNRMNATNSMVLNAIKGGRKTDATTPNDIFSLNATTYGTNSSQTFLSTTSQHQRLRYSAVKQRKITLRDVQLIFENDPKLRRSSALEFSYYKL